MKTYMTFATLVTGACIAAAQVPNTTPPPGAISRPPATADPAAYPPAQSEAGGSSLSFTNRYGARFSLSDLAAKLGSLRTAIEEAQPLLNAFNSEYASAPTGSGKEQQLTSSVSHLLSGFLNRNQNTSGANSSGANTANSGSPGVKNFLGLLSGLVNTNGTQTGAATLNRTTLNELQTLQGELQPIQSLLASLNIAPGVPPANATETPAPVTSYGTNQFGGRRPLTPTGR